MNVRVNNLSGTSPSSPEGSSYQTDLNQLQQILKTPPKNLEEYNALGLQIVKLSQDILTLPPTGQNQSALTGLTNIGSCYVFMGQALRSNENSYNSYEYMLASVGNMQNNSPSTPPPRFNYQGINAGHPPLKDCYPLGYSANNPNENQTDSSDMFLEMYVNSIGAVAYAESAGSTFKDPISLTSLEPLVMGIRDANSLVSSLTFNKYGQIDNNAQFVGMLNNLITNLQSAFSNL